LPEKAILDVAADLLEHALRSAHPVVGCLLAHLGCGVDSALRALLFPGSA
jgi:hypothetical protein